MKKILLWDIDGTLLNFHASEAEAIRMGFRAYGLGECTDEMIKDYAEINDGYWKKLERGEIEKGKLLTERFEVFFSKYGLNPSIASDFNHDYQLNLGETICFNDHGDELLNKFKGTYRQYAVTNGTKAAQTKKLARSGMDQLFDGVFISEDVGFEKPSIRYFERVFEAIGSPEKEEVLLIGDSLTSDIKGANNAGIRCVWYNPECTKKDPGLRIDYEIRDLNELIEIVKENG